MSRRRRVLKSKSPNKHPRRKPEKCRSRSRSLDRSHRRRSPRRVYCQTVQYYTEVPPQPQVDLPKQTFSDKLTMSDDISESSEFNSTLKTILQNPIVVNEIVKDLKTPSEQNKVKSLINGLSPDVLETITNVILLKNDFNSVPSTDSILSIISKNAQFIGDHLASVTSYIPNNLLYNVEIMLNDSEVQKEVIKVGESTEDKKELNDSLNDLSNMSIIRVAESFVDSDKLALYSTPEEIKAAFIRNPVLLAAEIIECRCSESIVKSILSTINKNIADQEELQEIYESNKTSLSCSYSDFEICVKNNGVRVITLAQAKEYIENLSPEEVTELINTYSSYPGFDKFTSNRLALFLFRKFIESYLS